VSVGFWQNEAKFSNYLRMMGEDTMHRHTRGTIFYHKGPLPPIPSAVHQLRIEKREGARACACGWTASGLLGCRVVVLVTRDAAGSGSGPALGYFGLQQLLNAIIKQNTRYLLG
jgi:hypothetical protein